MKTGEKIKDRRLLKRMSMQSLADQIGVVKSTIYRYETGIIPSIPADHLFKIARALDTTPEYLLDEVSIAERPKMSPKQKEISALISKLDDDQCEILMPMLELLLSKSAR